MGMAQLGPILRDLERQRHHFDLDNGLGEKLADAAADEILTAMTAGVDPDGSPWPELSEAYLEYKAQVAPGQPISVLFEHMRTPEQIAGERWFSPVEGRMVYGLDEQAKSEAEWFSEGNENQPARPFYEFNAAALDRMDGVCEHHLRELT